MRKLEAVLFYRTASFFVLKNCLSIFYILAILYNIMLY